MVMNREPTGNTCGDIDGIISSINNAIGLCDQGSDPEIEDLIDALHDIDHGLYGLEDLLEQLRTANSTLRDWGNEEAKEVDRLEDELSDATIEIDALRTELEDEQSKVYDLKEDMVFMEDQIVELNEASDMCL